MQDTARQVTIKGPDDFARAFPVSRETVERLKIYAALLPQWQKAVNLIAKSTLDDVWFRHIADSAQLASLAPDARRWADIGSGAGFPGMVIAIMRAEHGLGGVILVESDRRKCAFLADVRRQTGIAVDIVEERIETSATQDRVGQVDIVSARALASFSDLLKMTSPILQSDGTGLFLKGRKIEQELKEASRHWSYQYELVSSLTDDQARIVVVKKIEAKVEG